MKRKAARAWHIVAVVALCCASQAQADDSRDAAAGVLRVALPAAALAATWLADDPEGRRQWVRSTGGSLAAAYALKALVSKQRPDGSDDDAFPSGHATAAFAGAAFLDRRYGRRYGVPAYALATWVAWSRVESDEHDALDVLAGAALATGLTYWLVSACPDHVVSLGFAPGRSVAGVGVTLRFR